MRCADRERIDPLCLFNDGMRGLSQHTADTLGLVKALTLAVIPAGLIAGRALRKAGNRVRLQLLQLELQIAGIVRCADLAPLVNERRVQRIVDKNPAYSLFFVAHRHHAYIRIVRPAGKTAVSADAGFRSADGDPRGKLRRKRGRLCFLDDGDDLFNQRLDVLFRLLLARFETFNIRSRLTCCLKSFGAVKLRAGFSRRLPPRLE